VISKRSLFTFCGMLHFLSTDEVVAHQVTSTDDEQVDWLVIN